MIPDYGEIIKFDEDGNTGHKERLLAGIKRFLDSRLFYAVLLVLVAVVSFELGLLANLSKNRTPVTISEPMQNEPPSPEASASQTASPAVREGSGGEIGTLVASKTGTKYYFPWCGSASRISDKNKIYFATVAEARAKGYTPAANCAGLK